MRVLKGAFAILLTLAVFGISFLALFPWNTAAEVAWSRALRLAGEKGLLLDAGSVDGEGLFAPKVRLGQARLRSLLLSGEAGEVEIRLLPLKSLLSMAPGAAVRLERVSLNLPVPGEAPLYLASVEARVALRRGRAEVRDLKISGEIRASGDGIIDLEKMFLDDADIVLEGDRTALLEYFRSFLPLKKEKEGVWTLKRGGERGHGLH